MKSLILILFACVASAGCASKGTEMDTVEYVDIDRFMGDWYVIANIPTFLEKGAHNAVENYALNSDGTIATTFTFRDGGFGGKEKRYTPKGFIKDSESNALWGMRFIWPIKADYRIVYLDPEYQHTVIARKKRDFVWIMARQPSVDDAELQKLMSLVEELGYDMEKVQLVPQRW